MGRLMFANIFLAVGRQLLLVTIAEHAWWSAGIGVLLVAAAVHRIQGTLTKLARVTSLELKKFQLVPSDLQLVRKGSAARVDHDAGGYGPFGIPRVLLLSGLSAAALQVVLLEGFRAGNDNLGFQGLFVSSAYSSFI